MPEIQISAADGGEFMAYVAAPTTGGPTPAILVEQEIFGVNQVMRDLCDGYAAQGYLAICPDLFWRQQPGIQLTDQKQEDWDRAFALYQGFDEAAGVADIAATLAKARAMDQWQRQGRRGRLLPGGQACLSDRHPHRCRLQRRLLRGGHRGGAGRGRRHKPPANAAHRDQRPVLSARGAGRDQ